MSPVTLYIMCGFPFSGKSTFAKEVENNTSIVRVSFDEMWVDLLKKIPELTYDIAIPYIDKQIEDVLKQGVSVIYDSTNLKAKRRTDLIYLAERAGAEGVIVYIPTTIEEMYARQKQSLIDKSHHVVDLQNFDTDLHHLELPVDAINLATEEDKAGLMERLVVEFPKKI